MTNNGRLTDIFIEDNFVTNPDNGEISFMGFTVWTDDGLENLIKSIEGVFRVHNFGGSQTCYAVDIDQRYDPDYLRAEIEAAIKCKRDGEEER